MKQLISLGLFILAFYLASEYSDNIISSIDKYPEIYIAGLISVAIKPFLERFFG